MEPAATRGGGGERGTHGMGGSHATDVRVGTFLQPHKQAECVSSSVEVEDPTAHPPTAAFQKWQCESQMSMAETMAVSGKS